MKLPLIGNIEPPRPAIEFEGVYEPHVLIAMIPRREAEHLLPRSLELASSELTVPLYITVGQQSIRPVGFPMAELYQEAIFSIPGVRDVSRPEAGLFAYMPVIYVNRLLPMAVNKAFGFAKRLAQFQVSGSEIQIRELFGPRRVLLRFKPQPEARPLEYYAAIEQPAWTMRAVTFVGPVTLFSQMNLYGQMMVRPEEIYAEFSVPQMPFLPAQATYGAISQSQLGSFSTTQRYRFGLPSRNPSGDNDAPLPWPKGKRKLAILGGGVGAITAAYAITQLPGWQDHFEITIYEQGWRLGGKGASGRNADCGERIHEHGLHLWAGFYDNAFRLFRACYQDLKNAGLMDGVFETWADAFTRVDAFTQNECIDDAWTSFVSGWPSNNEEPGNGQDYLGAAEYLHMLLFFVTQTWHNPPASLGEDQRLHLTGVLDEVAQVSQNLLEVTEHLTEIMAPVSSGLGAGTLGAVEHSIGSVVLSVFGRLRDHATRGSWEDRLVHDVTRGLCAMLDHAQTKLQSTVESAASAEEKRWYNLLILGICAARGMLDSHVMSRGFEALDHFDLREFLERYGAPEGVLTSSIVRGGYDYVFGFLHGNDRDGRFAAGVAVRGALRVFLNYKGAIMWKMNAGMGDTIFTPYYKILKHRGVKFEFFSRVTNLGLDATRQHVDTIAIEKQATVKHSAPATLGWQLDDALTWAPGRKFDLVFDRGLMHCLPSQVLGLYKRQLLSWLRPGGQFVLVHVQREHWLDICPLGPSKRSGSQLRNHLAPEFSEIECLDEGQMRPLGVGPLLRSRGYRFRAQPTETSGHAPLTRNDPV